MIIIPETHEEWLQERKKGLGASDAGTILGVNKWKRNDELWAEKTGLKEAEDISDKPFVKYGHEAEEHIRGLFALDHPELKVTYESPYKIIRNDDLPYIFCTPDGEVENQDGIRGGLEIKTTEIMRSSQWDEWEGRIPDQYFCQVCHQMLAAGWSFVYLCAQIKYHTATGAMRKQIREYLITREDAQDTIDAIEEASIEFWKCVQEKKCPPTILPEI